MLKRLNDALPELVLGIILYGIAVELVGVWFVTDKLRYTTGLVIGIALAVGMAVNMAIVLRDAVEIYGGEHAQAKIIAKSILRYVIVVIVFFVMMKFNLGNLFTAFIGVQCPYDKKRDRNPQNIIFPAEPYAEHHAKYNGNDHIQPKL